MSNVVAISLPKRNRQRGRGGEAGFGVMELAIVVAIIAILATTSLIIFGKSRARYQLRQQAQNIAWQIERARMLAVKNCQTLTLGCTANNTVFGLTCSNCDGAKSELLPYTIPSTVTLSAYPTITIKGNGTLQATSGGTAITSLTLSDGQGRQVILMLSNAGRVTISDIYSG